MAKEKTSGNKSLQNEIVALTDNAVIAVRNADDAARASANRSRIAAMLKRIEAYFGPEITAAHQLHKSLMAKKNAFVKPLQDADHALSKAIGGWRDAEQSRIAADQARIRQEEEKRIRDAERARESGQEEKARELEDRQQKAELEAELIGEIAMPIPVAPVVEGTTFVEHYVVEVLDIKEFIAAVADGRHPSVWLTPDIRAIETAVNAAKGQIKIAGMRTKRQDIIRRR